MAHGIKVNRLRKSPNGYNRLSLTKQSCAYTDDDRDKDNGEIQMGTSLLELVANCSDFENEETMLQTKGQEMGVLVDRTPKCHC
jgi:hypothetical protein